MRLSANYNRQPATPESSKATYTGLDAIDNKDNPISGAMASTYNARTATNNVRTAITDQPNAITKEANPIATSPEATNARRKAICIALTSTSK